MRDTLVDMEESDGAQNASFMRKTKLAAAFAIVLVIGFVGGMAAGTSGSYRVFSNISLFDGLSATPDESVDLSDFWRAWNALNTKFVETNASSTMPTAQERVWGAIEGLAEAYGDPYTVYLPPEEAKMFQDDISGNFEGVGMEVGIGQNDTLTVIAPLKNTPAERAGMRAGDEILMINGTPTDGMSTDAAVKLIRGPKGTEVAFKVMRAGELIDIRVVRDVINVPTIESAYDAATGIYTISFYSFTATATTQFEQAIRDMRTQGAQKLIIDLRGNPGGYLDSAVAIASKFLPKGAAVVTEDYKGNRENIVHRSSGAGGVGEGVQVVILIDNGSASASEILAGALQDADRATLIGTRSFGKGSVQELLDLGGGSLKVTVARWLTPNGTSISDGGLMPDIEVERTIEDFDAGRDPQMARAIEFLRLGR